MKAKTRIYLDFIKKETGVDIFAKNRKRKTVDVRTVVCKILRDDHGLRYEEIGKIIGKHHATVIHMVENTFPTTIMEKDMKDLYVKSRGLFGRGSLSNAVEVSNQIEHYKSKITTIESKIELLEEQLRKFDNYESI